MALMCLLGRWGTPKPMSSNSISIASLSLLTAVACAMNLQFGRRPSPIARTAFGMSLGVALVALGAIAA